MDEWIRNFFSGGWSCSVEWIRNRCVLTLSDFDTFYILSLLFWACFSCVRCIVFHFTSLLQMILHLRSAATNGCCTNAPWLRDVLHVPSRVLPCFVEHVFLLGVVDTGAHRHPLGLSESLSIWVEQSPFIRNKLWRRDTVARDIWSDNIWCVTHCYLWTRDMWHLRIGWETRGTVLR